MLNNSMEIYTDKHTLCLNENKGANTLGEAYIYDHVKDPYQLEKIILESLPEVSKKLLTLLVKELKRMNDPWYQEKRHADLIVYN